ncbi:atp-binding cassette sub-family a member 2 [Limosa lapponica baueri]|uniref:Atp-binding cassette sub-family a member 2 n=1 Tax=Limosa lapponica baueri TaxID=1758121 RepID=A0A2I0TY49_LIMLA|nr:atp-binding cassette sub-family a member 2 [Limosa lapponica baueri]
MDTESCFHLAWLHPREVPSLAIRWVLAFEIFIPLVLFFILLGLRQKKPTIPVKEAFYTAAPLTSAGILPVMQSLCPDGQRDEFGFLQYSNSTLLGAQCWEEDGGGPPGHLEAVGLSPVPLARVTQLLEHLSEVVEQSSLFDPQHAGLEEELESLRRRLEALSSSEPSSMETHFSNRAGSGFTLGWAAKDQGELHRFLTQNLSLPNSTAELLLGSSVDLQEVYRLFFGSFPLVPDETHERDLWDGFGPSEKMTQLEALGLASAALAPTTSDSPQAFVTEMEGVLFTGPVLEQLTCQQSLGGLRHLLHVAPGQQPLLQAYRALACNGSRAVRRERFAQLATELQDQLDTPKIVSRLKLDEVNSTATQHRLRALLEDLVEMEKVLRDVNILSALAKLLPRGACTSKAPPPTANSTGWAGANATAGNATAEEEAIGGDPAGSDNPQGQFSAFVQLWAGLQPILCGNNR